VRSAAAQLSRSPDAPAPQVIIRGSTERDAKALQRLAELDSAPPPRGAHLLVEEGGELRAAVPMDGGRPLADPFHCTDDLVVMLEVGLARARSAATARLPGGLVVRSAAWLRQSFRTASGASLGAAGRAAS
jgi:hypothetical protein